MNFSLEERRERLKILSGYIDLRVILSNYGIEVMSSFESRKGGEEFCFPCPYHPTISANFTMNSENFLGFCRSAYCGVRSDLIKLVAHKEQCSQHQAFKFLCEEACIDHTQVDSIMIAESMLDGIGSLKSSRSKEEVTPMVLPGDYSVLAHPYMVKARGIGRGVLIEAQAGAIRDTEFYQHRAAVPIYMGGSLFSVYSRGVATQESWKHANPWVAHMVDSMYPNHHYTGASLTSRLLYGLDYVTALGFDEVILVEAIISVLKLRTLGIHNAVAMMKAGVSRDQVALLMNSNIKKVIICSDNDEKTDLDTGKIINPGRKAAFGSYKMLKSYFETGIATLPVNVDPADFSSIDQMADVLRNVFWPQIKTKISHYIETLFED